MKIAAGVQVGPYEVVEQVGRGGMATVFKAYQPALERMVAIKVLPDFMAEDPAFRERFRREAVSIGKLRHPGILTVYDHGEHEGQPYIVTEFVEGGTFADELGKPISVHRALTVLTTVASALDYAHERGILHRDVKPSNILVSKDGSAVLGDFGLARMMANNERLTRLDMVVGTPEYMSPEQCAGKEGTVASDQYALGVVAFEALTGKLPYHAETPAAVMLAQMQAPLPDPRSMNPSLSPVIDRALERALAKEPADRFPTCAAFVKALEGSGTEARAATPLKPTAVVAPPKPAAPASPAVGIRFPTGKPLVIAAAALVALLALAGIVYAASSGRGKATSAASTTLTPASTLPAHGSLIYEAKLSPAAWSGGSAPAPSPAGSLSIGYSATSIDFKIEKEGATVSSEFDGPALKNYVADIVMNVDQGSDFEMNWAVRNPAANETASIYLNIQVADENMTLVLSPNTGSNQALAATVSVPGLQSGSAVELYMVVNGDSIALYLNGKLVASGTESSVTGATTPAFDMDGKSGALHIHSLRYFATA